MTPASYRIEAQFAPGVWTNVTHDVLMAPGIHAKYGIRSGGPLDLVAQTGTCDFSLNNSEVNAARIRGFYSMARLDRRLGFDLGLPVRLFLGPFQRFYGWLDVSNPTLGALGPRDVKCTAVDWMDHAAGWKISNLPVLTNTRADLVFNAITAAVPVQPFASSAAIGSEVYPYALDTVRETTAMQEFQSLAQSEMAHIYDHGGTVTMDDRDTRRRAVPQFRLSGATQYQLATGSYRRKDIPTHVQSVVYPRVIDPALVVLATLNDKTEVHPSSSTDIVMQYVDPSQKASQVGGKDVVCVAGVDYTANARADGLGAGMTGSLTVTIQESGSSAKVTLTNSDSTQSLYVTSLQLRGLGLYTQESIKADSVADAATLRKYGENFLLIDMKYQASGTFGKAVADGVRSMYASGIPFDATVRFCASLDDTMMWRALSADIGTCFAIDDAINGSSTWFINGVDIDIEGGNILWVTWYLEHADVTKYWQLGVDVLGVGTIPAPF